MELIIDREEINEFLNGKEILLESSLGNVKINRAEYSSSIFMFRIEHTIAGAISGSMKKISVKDNYLKGEVDFSGSLKGALLNVFGTILNKEYKALSLEYPILKINLSELPLPVYVKDVLLSKQEVKITGEINTAAWNGLFTHD